MPKQIIPWKEFEIKNFKGIAASTVTPEINACTECENLDPRNDLISLRTRLGYTQKYAAPTNARMTGTTYLGSENFYVSHIDGDVSLAKEVTCYVNRGVLNASGSTVTTKGIADISKADPCVISMNNHGLVDGDLVGITGVTGMVELNGGIYFAEVINDDEIYICTDVYNLATSRVDSSGYTTYIIGGTLTKNPKPTNINMLNVWVRSYWSGTAWVNAWQWLNEAYLVKIYSPTTDPYIMTINVLDTSLVDYFNGWAVYNITRDETAMVVKSYNASTKIGIKISNNLNSWAAGDDLLFMRHYFPYRELVAMGTTAVAKDVIFHKVLDDLRISLGGKKDYHAIAIGYRRYYSKIYGFEYGSGDADLLVSVFNINRIILTPYNIIPYTPYDIQIETVEPESSSEALPKQLYYFKITAVLDNASEILVAEKVYDLAEDNKVIFVNPIIKIGSHNLRITSFDIYYSKDGKNYFYLNNVEFENNINDGDGVFLLGDDGSVSGYTPTELHTYQNAIINSDTDFNTTTGWTHTNDGAVTDSDFTVETNPYPYTGDYNFAVENLQATPRNLYISADITGLIEGRKYIVVLYASNNAMTNNTLHIALGGRGRSARQERAFTINSVWNKFIFVLEIVDLHENKIEIWQENVQEDEAFKVDALSIKRTITDDGDRLFTALSPDAKYIQDRMGYPPTYDMVKSWDNSLVSGGKVWVINPYLKNRYENKIFFSLVSGSGAFMWDVITGYEYLEMENYDGNNIQAVTMLPNLDFLLLRKNSTERRDSQVGTTREILFGNGIIAKKSAINFGDKVIWCSRDDVVMSNGNQVNLISDGTIRGNYREITDKSIIASIREDKESSYRMTTGTKEYVFTKVGWITEQRGNPPIHYLSSVDNKLIYAGLNGTSTDIFEETTNASDWNGDSIAFKWKSVPIDINLLGETITGNQRLYLRSIWLNYNAYKADCNVKVYLDNSTKSYPETGIPFTMGALPNYQTKKLPVGAFCRRFQLEISGYDYSGMGFEILSIGFMLKIIGIGKHDGR